MINIQVKQEVKTMALCHPIEMLDDKWPHGQVFQQYFTGIPQKDFYISCGGYEPSVVHVWLNDERLYRLSTDNRESLLGLNATVLVAPIEANVSITLEM